MLMEVLSMYPSADDLRLDVYRLRLYGYNSHRLRSSCRTNYYQWGSGPSHPSITLAKLSSTLYARYNLRRGGPSTAFTIRDYIWRSTDLDHH